MSPGAAVTPQAEVPPHPSASDFLPEHVPNTAELRRHPAAQPRAVPTSGRRRGPHRNPTLQRPGAQPGWGKADPKEPTAEDLGFFCLRAAGGILAGLGFLHGERAALKKNSFRVDGRAVTCSRLGVGAHGGGAAPKKQRGGRCPPPSAVIQPRFSRPGVGFHGKLPPKTSGEGAAAAVTQPQLEASAGEAGRDWGGGDLPTPPASRLGNGVLGGSRGELAQGVAALWWHREMLKGTLGGELSPC